MHRPHGLLCQFEGREHWPLRAANAHARGPIGQARAQRLLHLQAPRLVLLQPLRCVGGDQLGPVLLQKLQQALGHDFGGVLAALRQHVFAVQRGLQVTAAQGQRQLLLDVFGLPFFEQQHRCFTGAKRGQLFRHQGVGDVEHQDRQAAFAKGISQVKLLQSADQGVVQTALHNDPQVLLRAACKMFIQLVLGDEAARRRHALFGLALFMHESDGRMRQAHVVKARRVFEQVLFGDARRLIVARGKTAAHMARADAQLHDHRHVAGFAQLEALLHHVHHLRQIRPGVEQAHAGFERIGMGAFLDHTGAFAVVLAHHD